MDRTGEAAATPAAAGRQLVVRTAGGTRTNHTRIAQAMFAVFSIQRCQNVSSKAPLFDRPPEMVTMAQTSPRCYVVLGTSVNAA